MDGNAFAARKIALLAGGTSAEREISLASGEQVALSLALEGYETVPIDPAEVDLVCIDWSAFDVCFIALHGGEGEDGRVQSLLERLDVPYTGSGPEASRLAMSKSAAKERFLRCGVPTSPYAVFSTAEVICDVQRRLTAVGFPAVIKPESQGSSLGVSIARNATDVAQCLEQTRPFDAFLIAELLIEGREFTVSLLGRDPLPLIEIVSPQTVFSYEAKYSNPATECRFETNLPANIESRIYAAAMNAASALGTTGLARVDVMLDADHRPWVLEVNTIPGMTTRSLSPRAARAAGIDMPGLTSWMIRDALEQWRMRGGRRRQLAFAA
jgi:D-alanine-D-alanine ligase